MAHANVSAIVGYEFVKMHQRKVDFDAFALHQHNFYFFFFFMFHCIRFVCIAAVGFAVFVIIHIEKLLFEWKWASTECKIKKSITLNMYNCGWQRFSLKVCNWQSFARNYAMASRWKAKHYYHIWCVCVCAFMPEKHLITEFMHVSFFARNYYHVVAVRSTWKIWLFWTIC